LLRLFVSFTLAFYLLRDDYKIAQWFRRSFEHQPAAVTFVEQVDADLTTIYTGNLITIGASGLLAVSTYYVLDIIAPAGTGVQFPFLLGLLTGVATLIPAIGMKLIYYPYTGYLVWQVVSKGEGSLWFPVVFFLVTVVVVDVIPDFFIRSYVSKGELNMGLLLLTYVLGVVAFGWYGGYSSHRLYWSSSSTSCGTSSQCFSDRTRRHGDGKRSIGRLWFRTAVLRKLFESTRSAPRSRSVDRYANPCIDRSRVRMG